MRRAWGIGVLIVLLALACRGVWAAWPRPVRWDEPDLLILARNLLRGEGYHVFGVPDLTWPPVAPALAAISLAIGLPPDKALAAWHVVAGALACGLLYGLSREVTGDERVAAIAGLLAATSPALAVWPLYWGSLTESIFLAWLLAGLWAVWRVLTRGGWKAAGGAGVAFGLSYLTRPEGVLWWGLALLALLGVPVLAVRPGAARRRHSWRAVAVYVLTFLIVAAPYAGYLYRHTGRLMLSGKLGITLILGARVTDEGSGVGHDYAARLDSSGQEIVWLSPEQFDVSVLDVVREDPRGTLRRIRRNLSLLWNALADPLLGWVMIGLIGLGLWGERWSRQRWLGEMFWLAAALPASTILIFHVQPRFMVPLMVPALVWAGRGVLYLAGWASATMEGLLSIRPRPAMWATAIVALVLVFNLMGQRTTARAGRATLTPSHQAAGLWLAAHSRPDEPVMSRNPEVALYADRPLVAFPNAGWDDVLAYGRARGARYLVVNDWEITRLRPQLEFLLDPAQAPPELEHLVTLQGPVRRVVVYRIVT